MVTPSVESSAKGWKTVITCVCCSDRHRPAGARAGSWLDTTGTRSTADRRAIRQAGKNLPQTRHRRSRQLRHEPRVVGLRGGSSLRLLRRARQLGSMAGYRSGPGAGDTRLLRIRTERGAGSKLCRVRRQGAHGRDFHRGPPDGKVETAGGEPGRCPYAVSRRRLRQYWGEELGKFQIITDVYGGFSYTENLSQFLEMVLSLLATGGAFYTVLRAVHLEDGTDKLGTWYKTELVDPTSRPVKVCSWLRQTTCTRVTCESKSDWDAPTQLIEVRKVCSGVSVPTLKIVEYLAGAPPGRRFQLEK